MKKLFFFFVATLCITTAVLAQAPENINYQAVARNNAGAALANQTMKVRLTISRNAVTQYSETRQVTTNALGLFNVQIGSSGALATTGTFNAIDWMNNTPNMALKVELDINNSNVFTDMGSQAFSSVPFALMAKEAALADNTEKIAGRPLDLVTAPTVGSRLSWNGTNWTPVKKDTVLPAAHTGITIPAGGGNAPWTFAGGFNAIKTVTITGDETIVASFFSAFGHLTAGVSVPISAAVCYQNINGGAITEFYPSLYPETFITPSGGITQQDMTIISVAGTVKLPAGTYKIGMGIKNKHASQNLTNNGAVNGFVEVKY